MGGGGVTDFLMLKWHAKGLKSCKQHMQDMFKSQNQQTSEEHNTRGMQYMAHMTKTIQNRVKACQNFSKNMLRKS